MNTLVACGNQPFLARYYSFRKTHAAPNYAAHSEQTMVKHGHGEWHQPDRQQKPVEILNE